MADQLEQLIEMECADALLDSGVSVPLKRWKLPWLKRKLPVVFSTEQADQDAVILVDDEKNKKSTAGTVSYMPAVFGCYLAEYVIRRI